MSKYPDYIQTNLKKNKNYYSLYEMLNVQRCKVDQDYLGDVILVNENLIWHSVHKYIGKPEIIVKNNCIDKDDILQLGRMGFIKAIRAFDTTRGIKFSSFAVTAIVREIRCFLRDSASIMRPTRSANELINKINRIENDLGFLPSVEDLVILLGEPEAKVKKAIQIGRTVRYLDENIISHEQPQALTLLELIESNDALEQDVVDKVFTRSILVELATKLNALELKILQKRIMGYTQTQTAEATSLSQMRVSRTMKKIAKIIREDINIQHLLNSTDNIIS